MSLKKRNLGLMLLGCLFGSTMASAAERYYITTITEINWNGKADFKVPAFLKKVGAGFEWHNAYEIKPEEKGAYLFDLAAIRADDDHAVVTLRDAGKNITVEVASVQNQFNGHMHAVVPSAEFDLPAWNLADPSSIPTHVGFIPEKKTDNDYNWLNIQALVTPELQQMTFIPTLYHERVASQNTQEIVTYSSVLAPLIRVAIYYGSMGRISWDNVVAHQIDDAGITTANQLFIENPSFQVFATRLGEEFRQDASFDFSQPNQLTFKGQSYLWDLPAHPSEEAQTQIIEAAFEEDLALEFQIYMNFIMDPFVVNSDILVDKLLQ